MRPDDGLQMLIRVLWLRFSINIAALANFVSHGRIRKLELFNVLVGCTCQSLIVIFAFSTSSRFGSSAECFSQATDFPLTADRSVLRF